MTVGLLVVGVRVGLLVVGVRGGLLVVGLRVGLLVVGLLVGFFWFLLDFGEFDRTADPRDTNACKVGFLVLSVTLSSSRTCLARSIGI